MAVWGIKSVLRMAGGRAGDLCVGWPLPHSHPVARLLAMQLHPFSIGKRPHPLADSFIVQQEHLTHCHEHLTHRVALEAASGQMFAPPL